MRELALAVLIPWLCAHPPDLTRPDKPTGAPDKALQTTRSVTPDPEDIARQLSRLQGHDTSRIDDGDSGRYTATERARGYVIENIAGEGKPLIGRVHRVGTALELTTADGQVYRLTGPLARPRIAGPGYLIWVLGAIETRVAESARPALHARRLGVLAPPTSAMTSHVASVSAP